MEGMKRKRKEEGREKGTRYRRVRKNAWGETGMEWFGKQQ